MPSPSSGLAGRRILVIDDEESILELVSDSLRTRGCNVDCAGESERALELAQRNTYDVILCDLNLESIDGHAVSGFDLHDQIVKNKSRAKRQPQFIFMTGDLVEAAVGERAGREGNRFLQKPFRIGELLALLNDLPSLAGVSPKSSAPN